MLIRSQNSEILINFNTLEGIEITKGSVKNNYNIIHYRMYLSSRRIFHQSKSHESTGHDSGSLWRFGIHKICNSRSM